MFTTISIKKNRNLSTIPSKICVDSFIKWWMELSAGFPENYTENAISPELFGIFKNSLRCKKSIP